MADKAQDVLARAARRCGYDPTTIDFFGGNDPSGNEMVEYMADTMRDIVDRYDAGPLSAVYYISGQSNPALPFTCTRENPDGSKTNFPLSRIPGSTSGMLLSNFVERLHRTPQAAVETTGMRRTLRTVANNGDWVTLTTVPMGTLTRYYRILGDTVAPRLDLFPALLDGEQIAITVMTSRWLHAGSSSGAYATTLASGDDVPIIPGRILELGIVERFRDRRGLDNAQQIVQKEAALSRWLSDTRPRMSVNLQGPSPLPFDTALLWPWNINPAP